MYRALCNFMHMYIIQKELCTPKCYDILLSNAYIIEYCIIFYVHFKFLHLLKFFLLSFLLHHACLKSSDMKSYILISHTLKIYSVFYPQQFIYYAGAIKFMK